MDFLSLELKSNGKQNTAHIRYFPPRGKPKLDNIKTKLNNDALMADLLSPNANPKSPKLPPSRMSDITNKASASEDPPQITRKMAVVMGPAIKKSGHQASNSMPNLILKNKLNKLNQAKEPPKLGADEKELKSSSLSKELKPDDNEPHQVQNGKGNVQTQGSLTSSNNREKEMSKVNSKGADEPIMKPFGRSVSSLKNQFEPQPSSHSATTSERGLTVTKSQEGPRSSFAPKASEVSILKSQETIYKPAPKSNKQNDSSQGKLRKDEPKYASQPILAKETGRSKIQFKDEQPKPSFPPLKSKQGMGSKQSSQESIASSAGSLLAFNAENIDLFHKDDDKPQSKSNETIQPFVKKEKVLLLIDIRKFMNSGRITLTSRGAHR